MNKIIITLLILVCLLCGCNGGTAHLNNEETRQICVPYCSERNMSVNMDYSLTYANTIVCNCDSRPLLRLKNRY